jgi:hypothetical protein
VGCILSPLRGWFLGGSSGAEKVPDKLDLTSGAKRWFILNAYGTSGTRALPVREESRVFPQPVKPELPVTMLSQCSKRCATQKRQNPTSGKGGQKWGTRFDLSVNFTLSQTAR